MREIKFRCLNIDVNGRKSPEWIYFGIMSQPHIIGGYYNDDTLGQFTGLLDINGKEIYEGDIMKKSYGSSIHLFEVSYHTDRGLWIQNDGYNEPLCEVCRLCEVIGNIYEHPDLLK